MSRIAKNYREELEVLKKMVEESHEYFKKNYERYHEFTKFVFDTSLTSGDISKLRALKKPPLEFNVLESYISRLRGEFAQYEPDLTVRAADGVPLQDLTEYFIKTMDVIEAHLREIFLDSSNDSLAYNIYTDLLAGGFSVVKCTTEYINELSFEQNIKVERVFDPTLTFFDPMARDSHKGDGSYCGELIPMTKADFTLHFGEEIAKQISYTRDEEGFSWSYENVKDKIALVCYLYKKVIKKEKIAKLSTGKIILAKHYEELKAKWDASEEIAQTPIIIEERMSNIERICRYCFCENKLLDVVDTDYKYLPLVFFDGNSVVVKEKDQGASRQMTRPYVYHAKGIQKLKNFSGQTIANEIETMVQHKFKVAIESIPEDYTDAYKNPQQAQTLAYNAFHNGNTNIMLPPPMEIQRTPTPPIVQETFLGSDNVTQAILGSYDAQMGITNGEISGKAIQQGALHSNAAALPYTMGYIKGLNRLGVIMIDYIPKYYRTPRSLPIRKPNGMRSYQIINNPQDPASIMMDFDPNSMQIKIEAGVNSALQKQVALDQIIKMMGASEAFSQFMNSDGLEILVDNLEIRGIEQLKKKAEEYTQKQAQTPPPEDPMQKLMEMEAQTEQLRIEQKQTEALLKHSIDLARVTIEEQKADIEALKAFADIQNSQQAQMLLEVKHDSQVSKDAIDLSLQVSQHAHDVEMARDQQEQQQIQQSEQMPIQE